MNPNRTAYQLVLQLRPWGERHFDELVRLEEQVIELLGSDAEVDGHDLGSNEANIFVFCSDPPGLLPRCVAAAETAGLLPILAVAYRSVDGEVYTRLWPKADSSLFEVK
jgi:hypothetical protein